jgi:two-component system response regulator BaeR
MEIAVVEDEPKLVSLLNDYLVKEGYTTRLYSDGSEALSALQDSLPDLILLDLMLPGTDGLTICREIRKTSEVPVIMMTARVDEIDRLLGLEIGADDYICKPFSPREVVARVKAVLRRSVPSTQQVESEIDQLTVSEDTAQMMFNGESCALTSVELMLLKTLVGQTGRIFSRNQLMTRIYPDNRVVSDRTIDSHVKKLRQKIQSLDSQREYIHSVYGIGYKYEVEKVD